MRSDTQQERTNVWLARSVISDSADRGDNSHKSGLDSGHSQGRVRERTQIRAGRGDRVSSGVTEVFGFDILMTGLARVMSAAMIFWLSEM